MKKIFVLFMASFILMGIASALPAKPQPFYGYVTIKGEPAQDGLTIDTKISGETVNTTTTKDGAYGYNPVFWIDDPYNNRAGKVVKFYLGGIFVNETIYKNGVPTRIDLSITTTCGNDVCEPGEDSTNCCDDCGCSTGYECIDNSCSPICGDSVCQPEESQSSCCTDCGCSSGYTCTDNTCVKTGGGGSPPPPAPPASPPAPPASYCGDGECDADETCDTCMEDCGCCTPECQTDSDCDDGNECTIDTCATQDECPGKCTHTLIEGCEESQGECAERETKCEDGKQYTCELGPFGYWMWDIGLECEDGCCGNVCCGSENGGLIGTAQDGFNGIVGGVTGFFAGVPGGIFLPFGIVALAAIVIVFFIFGKRRKPAKKKAKK